jgi:hypothetical protein
MNAKFHRLSRHYAADLVVVGVWVCTAGSFEGGTRPGRDGDVMLNNDDDDTFCTCHSTTLTLNTMHHRHVFLLAATA